jgi:hypothetical protein
MADEDLTAVRDWAQDVADVLGIASGGVDLDAVLAVAGLSARAAVRPAAPVTTYLLGVAVGSAAAEGTDSSDAFATAVAAIRVLAASRLDTGAGESA